MKIVSILAAALVSVTGLAAAAPAAAQDRVVVRERVVTTPPTTHSRVIVRERTTRYREDRGRHYGWRNRYRTVCRTSYHHGERRRVCRRVRRW